jgi:Tfp pilus assembly protein PilN
MRQLWVSLSEAYNTMSNLLPENTRLELRSEYRARYVLAGSFLAIGAALFMSLSLLPSYVVFAGSLPKEQASQNSQEARQDLADITRAQALVVQFSPIVSSTSTISDALNAALGARPSGTHIDQVSYDVTSDNITIGGLADDRESMNAYRTALQAVPKFTSVKLPVGDLISSQGGRFTVTLAGNF